jgi:hypothetical protein
MLKNLIYTTASILAILPLSGLAASSPGSVAVGWNPDPSVEISGYKIHYGTESGVYTKTLDVNLATEASIPDLEQRRAYFCAVTAYTPAGLESGYSEELVVVPASGTGTSSGPRMVLLEAEAGTVISPLEVKSSGGDSWVESASTSQTGSVSLSFNVAENGNYTAWGRVIAPAAGKSSYFVAMDNGAEGVFDANASATPSSGWVWRKIDLNGGSYSLTAGDHTIHFRARDAGVKLDRVILSASPDFVPSDDLALGADEIAFVHHPSDRWTQQGGRTLLKVEAISTDPVQYQWMKNGSILEGQTGTTLSLSPTDFADGGRYSVTVWNNASVAFSNSGALTVLPPGPPQVNLMTKGTNNSVRFNFSGINTDNVEVYASENLKDWTLIGTSSSETGEVIVNDPAAQGATRRFYKLKSL